MRSGPFLFNNVRPRLPCLDLPGKRNSKTETRVYNCFLMDNERRVGDEIEEALANDVQGFLN